VVVGVDSLEKRQHPDGKLLDFSEKPSDLAQK
jgi:hypothetical protein